MNQHRPGRQYAGEAKDEEKDKMLGAVAAALVNLGGAGFATAQFTNVVLTDVPEQE